MANSEMFRFLVVTLLLISSYDFRVACDFAAGAQVELQQQQQQPSQQSGQIGQVDASAQAAGAGANTGVANGAAASAAGAAGDAGVANGAAAAGAGVGGDMFATWQQSALYVDPFDPAITTIPAVQREFVNKMVTNDLEFFREILREAIERRNKFAPSVGLIWKYAGKLLGRFISNRREEMKLSERIEPKPEFFRMLADLAESVIQQSTEVKKEKGYSKNNINTDELYRRVDAVFNYIQRTIEAAPMGAYLKWNQLILHKNDPINPDHDRPIVDLASDLTAVSFLEIFSPSDDDICQNC